LSTKIRQFYHRHEVAISLVTFVASFLRNIYTIGQVDDTLNLIHQAIYLIALGALLFFENKGKKLWEYQELLIHFLFGSLLSAFTIFYYHSASGIINSSFIAILALLLVANELPRFKAIGFVFRIILFNICLLSYFAFFWPIVLGQVGSIPFLAAVASSLIIILLIGKKTRFIGLIVHALFTISYYTALIPPVPVAIKKIGVYYSVVKEKGAYKGLYQKVYVNKDEFWVRPEDSINVLLSIYSPQAFKDRIYLKWFYDGHLEDTIPLQILGGRKNGFRGFGTKKFYRPGPWKITVETSDGREVGSISIEIHEDKTTNPRQFSFDEF